MKQIQFVNLLSQACGRNVLEESRLFDTGDRVNLEEARAAGMLAELAGTLEKFISTKKYSIRSWPGIWVKLERESPQDLKEADPELEGDDIAMLFELHFPHKEAWMRFDCWRDGDLFCLQVYPTQAAFALDLSTGQFLWSRQNLVRADKEALTQVMNWISETAAGELLSCAVNPEEYARNLSRALPEHERLGKIRRADLWEATPRNERTFIRDELCGDEISRFLEIAPVLKEAKAIPDLTLNDYLEYCALCYRAIGLQFTKSSPRQQYRAVADGRHEGLLDVKADSAKALMSWLAGRTGGGHPFEIVRGGNDTHIDLFIAETNEGLGLRLRGSSTGRAAETIKMALALHAAGVHFELYDVDLHSRRVRGEDWLGIVPDYYSAASPYILFPSHDCIRDQICHYEIGDNPALKAKIVWYPVEVIKPCC